MQPNDVIEICLIGATGGLGLQAVWDISWTWHKIPNKKIVVLKFLMASAMTTKAILNAISYMPLYDSCGIVTKIIDILYHTSMSFAAWILLSRATMVLVSAPKFTFAMEYGFLTIRIAIGVADTIMSHGMTGSEGTCVYVENHTTGLAYAIVELLVDLYVTIAIVAYLKHHSTKLNRRVFGGVYGVIVSSNLLRTLILLAFNIASLVVDSFSFYEDWRPLVWSSTNIAYIIAVIYDADMTRVMASIQQNIAKISKPIATVVEIERSVERSHQMIVMDMTKLTQPSTSIDKEELISSIKNVYT